MLEDVTAIAETATTSVSHAVSVESGSVEMNNVTAISLGGVSGSDGLGVLGTATATARNSRFRGFFYGVNLAPNATVNLISTQLDGGRSSGGATYNCVGAYDGNFNALDGNCDPIP